MTKIYKRLFVRNDNKEMFLYGYNQHSEKASQELEVVTSSKPHLRWHPSREEWVTYSADRKNRTAFPPKEYCPLCPSGNLSFPTEIPFNNFEIAVLPNRWPSFNLHNESFLSDSIDTKPSKGQCEVVVYSSGHKDTVAEMKLERIKLLIYVWIDRYKELLKRDDIKYVMPFENRGEECGVTLHHPHGQIYAYPFIPPIIKKELEVFKKNNFILEMMDILEKKYFVYQDENVIAAVPPFARYAYEIWIMPKRKRAGPWEFNTEEIQSFSTCLQKVVKGYDSFLDKKCPYIMGLHAAPTIKHENFHFHIEFYPPLRHGDKPKILAGSESMAGVYIMDVLPEETAKQLRAHMK
tara:strand:- start:3317 stop:4366 length:1050 start_codon:yes stop_codon:yes gene_type:complete